MNLESFSALDEEITKEDWKRTPSRVRRLLRWLLEDFQERLADLEEDKVLSDIEKEAPSIPETKRKSRVAKKQAEVRCSFCGKLSEDVSKVITGPNVSICNECIEICNEILADDLELHSK
ncbi:MAG TPA: ClpX C4-type zinc finger protein [Nitrososphaera sp.]|nr:ClpX C4-type zinc finger protein [Nitrososphaera sp.]